MTQAQRDDSVCTFSGVLELLMTVIGVVVIVDMYRSFAVGVLVAWDALGIAYVVIMGLRLRRSALSGTLVAGLDNPSRMMLRIRSATPAVTSLIGVVASLMVLFGSGLDQQSRVLVRTLGVVTMVLAWILLHYNFGYRYYITDHQEQGLVFPGQDPPRFVDYVYFAMTVGTSFAASDVNVTTSRMRWQATVHSVVGFFYNAVVMAIAFKILTGG